MMEEEVPSSTSTSSASTKTPRCRSSASSISSPSSGRAPLRRQSPLRRRTRGDGGGVTNQTRLHGSLAGGGATASTSPRSASRRCSSALPCARASVDDLLGPNYCEAALLLTVAILFMYGYSLKPMGDLTMAGQADSHARAPRRRRRTRPRRLWRVLEVFDAPRRRGGRAALRSRSDCDVSARATPVAPRRITVGAIRGSAGSTAALVLIALLTAGFGWCACGGAAPPPPRRADDRRARSAGSGATGCSAWERRRTFFTIRRALLRVRRVSTFLARNVVDIGPARRPARSRPCRDALDAVRHSGERHRRRLSARARGEAGSGRGGGGDDGVAAEGLLVGDASVGGGAEEAPARGAAAPMRPRASNMRVGDESRAPLRVGQSRRASHAHQPRERARARRARAPGCARRG